MNNSITYALLIPCYNAEKYIASFITQLSNLNVAFDEVLFYDDASTDKTVSKIEEMGFKVIKGLKNMGPGYSRNRLAEISKSNYIHFHDIDDEISKDFLVYINETLIESNTDVIIGFADWIDEKTRNLIIKWQYNEIELQKDPLIYLISNPVGIINTVYKKSVFLNVGGFDESKRCWEDADLHIRLAMANSSFCVVNKVLAFSIRHENGISNNQELCWQCRVEYLDSYKQTLKHAQLEILGEAYEKAAYALFFYKKNKLAQMALIKSRSCGYDAPKLNNSFFKMIKAISPMVAFLLKAKVVLLLNNYKR